MAVARLRAARAAIDEAGGDTLLVGRAENFLAGRPDLDDTIARLRAYAEAGADCLYAPGIRTREQIAAVVAAVAPKPVNLLVGGASELTLADIAALGVRRVSVGGALARAAWGGFMRAAQALAEQGRFDGFADAASGRRAQRAVPRLTHGPARPSRPRTPRRLRQGTRRGLEPAVALRARRMGRGGRRRPVRRSKTEVTERQAKSILNHNQSPDLAFDYTINPYQGCEHGCVYCFARPTHAYLNLSPGLDFETKLFAKMNAAEVLRKELGRKDFDPGIVALGAVHRRLPADRPPLRDHAPDPGGAGRVRRRRGHHDQVGARHARHRHPRRRWPRKGLVRVHMSIPTLDHELSRRLDPRANSPTRRLEAIEELTGAGIPVAVYIAPVIPLR